MSARTYEYVEEGISEVVKPPVLLYNRFVCPGDGSKMGTVLYTYGWRDRFRLADPTPKSIPVV